VLGARTGGGRGTSPAERGVPIANPVIHFEVLGKDPQALQRFYGGAFGWQMQDVMGGSDYMADPGVDGAINGGVGAAPEGGDGHVTFSVGVADPEGHVVGLVKGV
jgi:uncharacterized protein